MNNRHALYSKTTSRKCQEQNVNFYMNCVVLIEAFYTVSRDGLWKKWQICSKAVVLVCSLLAVFGVRVSVMFHFMFVHYTFSSVWVAEWLPFWEIAARSVSNLFSLYLVYL